MADGRKTPGHFYEKPDADNSKGDRPDQIEAKTGPGLKCRRKRAGLQKTADTRDNAERNLKDLFHGGRVGGSRLESVSSAFFDPGLSECSTEFRAASTAS